MISRPLVSKIQIYFFLLGFVLVYGLGMFIPLMENDSAQHATMAMRMAKTGNYWELWKGDNPYLDKPHLHFWLSAFSMKLLGINAFAYRLPAVVCLFLASFAVKKISNLLYQNENQSLLAALVFLSAQTIILSGHDVRTDAVLTGFVALAIWKSLQYIKTQKIIPVVWAGLFTAMAFSAKGLIAVVIIGFSIFSYLLYSREWKKFFNYKIVLAVFGFGLGILPILYAYYHQFGKEGIEFILLNQSVDRLQAKGFTPNSPDYFFFFHTLLWAFLPFSIAFYTGIFQKTKELIITKFRKVENVEFLTLGGFWMVILLFSSSQFKLPHYINGLIPIISVFTSAYIYDIYDKNQIKKGKIFGYIQVFISLVGLVGVFTLVYYFTGIQSVTFFYIAMLLYSIMLYLLFIKINWVRKWIMIAFFFMIGTNIFLNSHFYPVLTEYQGGLKMARYFKENKLTTQNLFMPKDYEIWTFDFYTQQNTPRKEIYQLVKGDRLLIFEDDISLLNKRHTLIHSENHFRITRLSLQFLYPSTRSKNLKKIFLVEIL